MNHRPSTRFSATQFPVPQFTALSLFILGCLLYLFTLSPAAAQEIDKNDSPVTGRLPDAMTLSIHRKLYGSTAHPAFNQRWSILFCVEGYDTRGDYFCRQPDRKLKMRGKRQRQGITISPPIEGEWRWVTDYQLSFRPKNPWVTAQTYKVTVDRHLYSKEIFINTPEVSFTTAQLTAHIESMTYFQDPSDFEKKGVTTEIIFNSPVDEASVKSHLQFSMEAPADKPAEGKRLAAGQSDLPFDIKLDARKMRATVSLALKTLPSKEQFLVANLKNGVLAIAGGDLRSPENPKTEKRQERVLLPSVGSYAKVSNVDARIVKNTNFEPEQVIAIETNVPIPQDELKKQLSVKLLPRDKPAATALEVAKKNHRWEAAAEVTDEVRKSATPIEFALNPVESDKSTLFSAKINAEPGRWALLRLAKGTKCRGGYVLGEDYDTTFQIPEYGNEARLLSDGALLPLTGEKKVSVYALGVEKLEFEVGRVLTSNLNHLISQTSGSFSKPSFDNWKFSENNVIRREVESQALAAAPPNKPQFTVFDFSKYLKAEPDARGLFFLSILGKKMRDGKEVVMASDKRFILITDVGFYVKSARDGSSEVFAQSVQKGTPVGDATVEVLGLNGIPIFSSKTDASGRASVPDLKAMQRERAPVAYVIRSGEDLTFMPYQRSERELNYSRFETGGQSAVEDGLRAYMFSDRGIYRPGDQVNLGMIVKQGDWAKSLEGLPLHISVNNPRGQRIEKKILKLNSFGFLDYSFSTKDTSPTGVYQVSLSLAENETATTHLTDASVRIEEFLPDTMKITSAFNKGAGRGWVTPDQLKAEVTLMHLYGAPAVDHRVHANININPGNFSFGGDFKDYSFFDPKQTEHNYDQDLGNQNTNDQGKTSFDINLSSYGDSTYRLTFYAEGFAAGSGRSVRTAKTVLVSSLPYVIGLKAEGNLSYINKDTTAAVQLIALSPDLLPRKAEGLTAELSKINYVSTLVRNEYGSYVYRSIPQEKKVSTKSVTIPEAGLRLPLESNEPGDFVLTLVDEKGLKRSKVQYTVVGVANLLGHERKEAVISAKLNKPKYVPGEEVEINVVAPYAGAGLITLETERVLAHQWFRSQTESSVQKIKLPDDFTGKGYLNVQFVRDLASKQVFTEPLAYTVVPLFVSTDARDSKIQLTVPELIQPGEVLTMKYKTKEKGKIVVFAVDEGILQYARYVSPDPLNSLLNTRALQVQTHQIFDLLLPEFSLLQQLAATGGDGALADGKNLNPFKRKTLPPVAYWSGIIDADVGEHEAVYHVPDYFNGSIRVLAVAVTTASIGAAETKVPVKGDLIVSPNAPTFVAPGDEFEVGVQVTNNIQKPGAGQGEIEFSATPSEHLEVLTNASTKLTIAQGRDTTVNVRVRAKDAPGGASLLFVAKSGSSEAKYEATLSVRPPVPSMTVLNSGYVEKGDKTVEQDRQLYQQFSELGATVSTLPVSLIPGLQDYLMKYPYGCTEQLVSRVFPSVVLYGEKELLNKDKAIAETLSQVLSQLRERQRSDGGLGMWWRSEETSDFITAYALHFLLVAKSKNLPVPNDMIQELSNYLRNVVNQSVSSLTEARHHAYGIYVLTKGGMVTSNYIPYILQYLEENHKDTWKQDISAMYLASTYKLLQLNGDATKLFKEFAAGEPVYWRNHPRYTDDSSDTFYDSLIRYSMYLNLVSEHFPETIKDLDRNILFRVANFVGEGSYNTTSSSFAVLALTNYAKASTAQVKGTVNIAASEGGSASFQPLVLVGELLKQGTLAPSTKLVQFSGGGSTGLFYQISTTGFDKTLPKSIVEQGVEVSRRFLDDQKQAVKQVKIGDTVEVEVKLMSQGDAAKENMVLVDLLPGGFEVVPESIKPVAAAAEEGSEGEGEEGDDGAGAETASEADGESEGSEEDGTPWETQANDVREDRVLVFGSVPTDEVLYRYKIKAVNTGTYVVPPAYLESMYDRSVKARGLPEQFTVTPAQ